MEETGNKPIKINEVVKQLLFERHQTAVDLSDGVAMSNDSTYKLLRRSDWRISEMDNAGSFLGVNLFEWFVPKKADEADLGVRLKTREDELSAMKVKMDLLEQENKYLKELVEMAKMKLKH